MMSKFMFSSWLSESCANKLVWYLFETLSVATRFNPELMGLLIEVNSRKGPNLGLCCRELGKFGTNFWHLCCKLEELHSTFFPKLRFEYIVVLTFRSKDVPFTMTFVVWTTIGITLSKIVFLCRFLIVFDEFQQQIAVKCSKILNIHCWIRHCIEFFKPFYAKK